MNAYNMPEILHLTFYIVLQDRVSDSCLTDEKTEVQRLTLGRKDYEYRIILFQVLCFPSSSHSKLPSEYTFGNLFCLLYVMTSAPSGKTRNWNTVENRVDWFLVSFLSPSSRPVFIYYRRWKAKIYTSHYPLNGGF